MKTGEASFASPVLLNFGPAALFHEPRTSVLIILTLLLLEGV
jgi:hypothetical protein